MIEPSECHQRAMWELEFLKIAERVFADPDDNYKKYVAEQWSARPWLPLNLLKQFPDAEWDWRLLSGNFRAVPLSFIEATQDTFPWHWGAVTMRPELTADDVGKHPRVHWDTDLLLARDILSGSIDHLVLPLGDEALTDDERLERMSYIVSVIYRASSGGTINQDLVERNLHLPLNFDMLSRCKRIHKMAIKFPDEDWDWTYLTSTAPVDLIAAHPDLFGMRFIDMPARQCKRAVNLTPESLQRLSAALTIQVYFRRHQSRRRVATRLVQKAWIHALTNPEMRVCKKLMRRKAVQWNMRE